MTRRTGLRHARPARSGPGTALPAPSGTEPAASASALRRWATVAALLASLAALLAHARAYLFLTDDAFISFRYARNLSHGFGLVFNPGGERVEGYSNFLWVLILAALDRVGFPPERAAQVLSLGMTVALWALVVWFAWRTHRTPRPSWVILVPAFCLAITRSVAVWSSGGLETRMFELLLIGGVLRLIVEIEAARDGGAGPEGGGARRAVAPWLFALASLTRPDGLLLSLSAFAAGAWVLWQDRRAAPVRFLAGWLPFAILVGAQFAFRRGYYHEWFPNTYYAKIAGLVWWSSGLRYVSAFALEYAAILWIPLLVGAVLFHRRRGSGYVPLMFAGVVLPHLVYVTAIGGDHFEYRPLDLYFPLIFLLLADGAREWGRRRALAAAVPVYVALVMLGLFELPYQSHRQFPREYLPGFPGEPDALFPSRESYLRPEDDPVYRLPGLRSLAAAHRQRLVTMTAEFVGIRQEEHRLFLATVVDEGRYLHGLVERGTLPADFHVAMDCVGAIPYYSDLRTLDRLGLTDARVAHSPFVRRIMAHGKSATIEYARESGVDLWSTDPVHSLCPITSRRLLTAIIDAGDPGRPHGPQTIQYAAEVGGGHLLVGSLPQGLERASARAPRLRFRALGDTAFVREFVETSIPAYQELLRADPGDFGVAYRFGYICMLGHRYQAARAIYQWLDQSAPGHVDVLENLASCQEVLRDVAGARNSLTRLLPVAQAKGDPVMERRIRDRLRGLGASPPGP